MITKLYREKRGNGKLFFLITFHGHRVYVKTHFAIEEVYWDDQNKRVKI